MSAHKTWDWAADAAIPGHAEGPGNSRVSPPAHLHTPLVIYLKSSRALPCSETCQLWRLAHSVPLLDALPPRVHLWKPHPHPWSVPCSKGHLLGPQDVGLQYGPRGRSLARECGSLLRSPWRFCPLLSISSRLTGLPDTQAVPTNPCFQGGLLKGPLCCKPLPGSRCPKGKVFPGQDLLLPHHIWLSPLRPCWALQLPVSMLVKPHPPSALHCAKHSIHVFSFHRHDRMTR